LNPVNEVYFFADAFQRFYLQMGCITDFFHTDAICHGGGVAAAENERAERES